MKHLLDANSIYNLLLTRSSTVSVPTPAIDISSPVLSALASLSLAEATLIAVLKDDPYPAAVAQDRNKNDKDWMFKAPEMPKVRAHLFARLCLAAADHASEARAMLERAGNVSESLARYLEDLRRTARGKACRFLGIDAEVPGDMGTGIAWLKGAKRELGFVEGDGEEGKRNGFAKLRKEWKEKREDRQIERGGEWGSDAGRFEEGRVVEMLLGKWTKMNDTVCSTLFSKTPQAKSSSVFSRSVCSRYRLRMPCSRACRPAENTTPQRHSSCLASTSPSLQECAHHQIQTLLWAAMATTTTIAKTKTVKPATRSVLFQARGRIMQAIPRTTETAENH